MSRYPVCKFEILRIANQFKDLFHSVPVLDPITGNPRAELKYDDDGYSITLEYSKLIPSSLEELRDVVVEEYKSRFPKVEIMEKQGIEWGYDLYHFECEKYTLLRVYYNDPANIVKKRMKGV